MGGYNHYIHAPTFTASDADDSPWNLPLENLLPSKVEDICNGPLPLKACMN